jgi:hypothetical protein
MTLCHSEAQIVIDGLAVSKFVGKSTNTQKSEYTSAISSWGK